jgi:hemerythrin HHE cation binding domain-containing protein
MTSPRQEILMSILDKVVAAVTPLESEEKRREARQKARAMAGENDWLALVLQHHDQIEAAFTALGSTRDPASRLAAQKELALLLTGHANAEEAVLYPALVYCGHKSHAMTGYTEQAGAKANLGELEYLDPMSQDYIDKLGHIRGAVLHHMYEEESDRFPDLKRELNASDQERLTRRFKEEFERYIGADPNLEPAAPTPGLRPQPRASSSH